MIEHTIPENWDTTNLIVILDALEIRNVWTTSEIGWRSIHDDNLYTGDAIRMAMTLETMSNMLRTTRAKTLAKKLSGDLYTAAREHISNQDPFWI